MLRSLGQTEIVITLVVVFILVGHRIPNVMQTLGRRIVDFNGREQDTHYWMEAIDLLMIVVVFVTLAALLMHR